MPLHTLSSSLSLSFPICNVYKWVILYYYYSQWKLHARQAKKIKIPILKKRDVSPLYFLACRCVKDPHSLPDIFYNASCFANAASPDTCLFVYFMLICIVSQLSTLPSSQEILTHELKRHQRAPESSRRAALYDFHGRHPQIGPRAGFENLTRWT